jgi:galactose-1-phosphate uridylyltransferase
MAVFCERIHLLEMDEQDFGDFSRGLTNLLRSYFALGIDSFNLSLLSGVKGDPSLWVHSRITPYYPRHAFRSNDATCFEMLHNEPISLMKPEEMAARLRPYFSQEPTRDAPAIRFMVTPQ